MKHNKLVEKLLNQFPGDAEVFFKTPDSPIAIPVAHHMYEVDDTLVFFKEADSSSVATINSLLCMIDDNYYTSDEGKDDDFMVAISNIFDWDNDDVGFDNLLCITDAVQIDNKVVLTTTPFDDAMTEESSEKLTIVSTDSRLLNKFIKEIDELRNSLEFNKSIHIF